MIIAYKTAEKARKYIINALLIAAVLLFLLACFGKYRPELIMSDSMYPVLKKGNIVLAQRISTEDGIECGKVYTYKTPDKNYTVTHRCIGYEYFDGEIRYIFKGDNNDKNDPVLIRKSWIIYILPHY